MLMKMSCHAFKPINGQELVKCKHIYLLPCNPKNISLNIGVVIVTYEPTLGPIHTKRKWDRKQNRSKKNEKQSKNKRQTSKKIFAFAFVTYEQS